MEQNENIVVLIDEEGKEVEFEVHMTIEVADNNYAILMLTEERKDDVAYIFRITVDENGEDVLEAIEDDDEYTTVVAAYETIANDQ
ncbi:MAG: hypothetical protein COA82_04250 [Alkaliphilus sp.]|jgi:uncharacterized protein YrzB (UPF0473 family)|nr:DUF1292 domain-containing protein [bacterium AH-315-E09]PHS35459.1 MAG: hypothetical protein COA82_04250 [Alkaliphilus sp.]